MKQISFEMPLKLIVSECELSDFITVSLKRIVDNPDYFEAITTAKEKSNKPLLLNCDFEVEAEILNDFDHLLNPETIVFRSDIGSIENIFYERPHLQDKAMVIVSGDSFGSFVDNYCWLRDFRYNRKDIPFIGFDSTFSWVENNSQKQVDERFKLLTKLNENKIVDRNRKHHLFDTWYAREFLYYRDFDWVSSVNTSNPVMAAFDGTRYDIVGIPNLPTSTLDSVFNNDTKFVRMDLLYFNCGTFRKIVNG